jgi:hypothetical protein
MSSRNEEQERKSWESSKSENCEEMSPEMYQMQNYNPCMCCPMMYGNMNMQGYPMMQGPQMMQGAQMMPKYGKGAREEDFREEQEQELDQNRPYYGHQGHYGHNYGHNYGHHYGHHYYQPFYNYFPFPYFYNYGDYSE